MEIRDPIHGAIELTPAETAIIDNSFFQRLRNIKQLGFGEFSFPGATHNRYCHSLGAMHLAGLAFDSIFKGFAFSSPQARWRFRQTVRLAALLHDVGHGPLSHSTEEVMPRVKDLHIKLAKKTLDRKANHEDYTLKIVTDSSLSKDLSENFKDLNPIHVACLIDKEIKAPDDFFIENGLNFRPILSQIVSSELDVDRMDYLVRDSYYCGTSYGQVELRWIIANLTHHQQGDAVNLALDRRAVFTFDDFLLSRLHMYLVVYFHHKSVVYDEMLIRFLRSPDCDFFLPADINEYLRFDDHLIHSRMAESRNHWAQLISKRKPYRMLTESTSPKSNDLLDDVENRLKTVGIDFIRSSSTGRLSKYYGTDNVHTEKIYLVDRMHKREKPALIEEGTEIFERYQNARRIDRLYVNHADYKRAGELL